MQTWLRLGGSSNKPKLATRMTMLDEQEANQRTMRGKVMVKTERKSAVQWADEILGVSVRDTTEELGLELETWDYFTAHFDRMHEAIKKKDLMQFHRMLRRAINVLETYPDWPLLKVAKGSLND